ncbi:MAG: NADP-dependent oxidoreductase [Anaerolineae bacterium]
MKAVRIHGYGDPDVLKYEDAPTPTLKPDQVLVRVRGVGINPVDVKTRAGKGLNYSDKPFPLILGWDIAGEIAETTAGAPFAVGDAVYGMVEFPGVGSAYAEYVAANWTELAKAPQRIDLVTAAGVPLVGLTAWQALFEVGKLEAGARILIPAAAGGVGHIAVQLAKWKGATVIGTASARNHDYLREIGVDQVIDYTKQSFEEVVKDVDFVLNTTREDDTLARSFKVLRRGGTLISIAGKPDEEQAKASDIHAESILVKPSGEQMAKIAELIDAGYVKPAVERVFPLAAMNEAHRLQESGHVRGKIVLRVGDE